MKYSELYDFVVPVSKRSEEKKNIFDSKVCRPISILITLLLLKTDISATAITKASIMSLLISFFILSFSVSLDLRIIGWVFVFIWAILDNVDGNIARWKKQCSNCGDLWDTMGGYIAIIVINYAPCISAFFCTKNISFIPEFLYLILGGLSSLFAIFPRLLLQKKRTYYGKTASDSDKLTDKSSYGFTKTVIMNLISPTGFIQLILLGSILFNVLSYYSIFYFFVNLVVMLVSLRHIFRF